MTNEELRQLEAEADAYQAEADSMRSPRYSQESLNMHRTTAFANGYADCLDRFNRPPGEPAHLPEQFAGLNTGDGVQFYITRESEDADPSVGIQAWECFIVTPNPHIVRMLTSHYDLLDACRAALADRFGGDDPCCDTDPITNQLRAAIKAATGGA